MNNPMIALAFMTEQGVFAALPAAATGTAWFLLSRMRMQYDKVGNGITLQLIRATSELARLCQRGYSIV